jgi:hypothetical protein
LVSARAFDQLKGAVSELEPDGDLCSAEFANRLAKERKQISCVIRRKRRKGPAAALPWSAASPITTAMKSGVESSLGLGAQ